MYSVKDDIEISDNTEIGCKTQTKEWCKKGEVLLTSESDFYLALHQKNVQAKEVNFCFCWFIQSTAIKTCSTACIDQQAEKRRGLNKLGHTYCSLVPGRQ